MANRAAKAPARKRPSPPRLGLNAGSSINFAPAPEVKTWVQQQILAEDGALHNPEHAHLIDADLRFLWAADGFSTKGRTVIGTAEKVEFRCNAWQRGRQEQQLREWFGQVPDYLITLDASYCETCSDADFCALVEHELYHVAQERGFAGEPLFKRDGTPKIFIRGHDVEEFVGVVKRYGVGDPNGALAKLAAAARGQPEVSKASIAGACGTCLLRAA
jgi:hypothetical protein